MEDKRRQASKKSKSRTTKKDTFARSQQDEGHNSSNKNKTNKDEQEEQRKKRGEEKGGGERDRKTRIQNHIYTHVSMPSLVFVACLPPPLPPTHGPWLSSTWLLWTTAGQSYLPSNQPTGSQTKQRQETGKERPHKKGMNERTGWEYPPKSIIKCVSPSESLLGVVEIILWYFVNPYVPSLISVVAFRLFGRWMDPFGWAMVVFLS